MRTAAIASHFGPSCHTGGGCCSTWGAGFGRLVDEYAAFTDVVLIDTSPAMLDAARDRVAGMSGVAVLGADAANLPILNGSVDVIVAVRLLVHVADPGDIFREIARVLRPGGSLILEYPNRRHLLSVLRRLTRRQSWSPSGAGPIEYLAGHFAHQPATIESQLRAAGLAPDARRAVSLFRSTTLKRLVPAGVLAAIEARLQRPLGRLSLSPSIYVRSIRVDPTTLDRVVPGGVTARVREEIDCES